jgi:hypothetical protein
MCLGNRKLRLYLLGLLLALVMCTSCAAEDAAARGDFYTAFIILLSGGGY